MKYLVLLLFVLSSCTADPVKHLEKVENPGIPVFSNNSNTCSYMYVYVEKRSHVTHNSDNHSYFWAAFIGAIIGGMLGTK